MSDNKTPSKKRALVSGAIFFVVAFVALAVAAIAGAFIVDFLHVRELLPRATPPVSAEAPAEPAVTVPHQLQIDVSILDTNDAVLTVRGDGSRTVYFFSNPDCPPSNVKKQELEKMDNVSIYTFWLPGPTELTKSLAATLFCDGKKLQGQTCDESALERNEQMVKSLGLTAPALITPAGDIIQGLTSVRILEAAIRIQERMEAEAAESEAAENGSEAAESEGESQPKESNPALEAAFKVN